jgi:hypothetical protein
MIGVDKPTHLLLLLVDGLEPLKGIKNGNRFKLYTSYRKIQHNVKTFLVIHIIESGG